MAAFIVSKCLFLIFNQLWESDIIIWYYVLMIYLVDILFSGLYSS